MRGISIRRIAAFAGFLLVVAGLSGGVWWVAFTASLDQVANRGRAELFIAADRLVGQLQRYGELAVLLSDHPTLLAMLDGTAGDPALADALLLQTVDKTGALEMLLVSGTGKIVASSEDARDSSEDFSDQAVFHRAMQGALGAYHTQNATDGRRLFTYAAPVFDFSGATVGALVVRVDMANIENAWRGDLQAVFFTDAQGVVFVTNRSELLLRQRANGDGVGQVESANYPARNLRPFLPYVGRDIGGHEIWAIDAGRYLPSRAIHLTLPLPVIDMTGEVLFDLQPTIRISTLQAGFAAAVLLVFGAFLFLLLQRRHALAEKLEVEARAKNELEHRVAARTHELSDANINLRREVSERQEAEAALVQAQSDLVQAGKLSALGEMSAGISHELNQPLMAIRSFAENAEVFLERGNTEVAAQNLGRISELSRRMGRIIKNLRAFARQENEPMGDVDICAVIDAVLEMNEARLINAGVKVHWEAPKTQVLVRGGDVRLQQVMMNLISNAVDAMEGIEFKQLWVDIEVTSGRVMVHVRDSGPGIDQPEMIFDPFYTTKAVGRAEGMGLGLSISYGLVQSFGGVIRGRNHESGGAVFTVELDRSGMERAA